MSVVSEESSIMSVEAYATQEELDRCHWHRRLGHPSPRKFDYIMRELLKRPELAITQKNGVRHDLDCVVCKLNKCKKSRWRYSLRHATFPLQMVYINLTMRPADEKDRRNGAPIIVVDDYTRYSWVLEPKGRTHQDIKEALEQWLTTVERQSNSRVKSIGIRTSQVNKLGVVQDWLRAIGIGVEWLDSTLSTDDADIAGRHQKRLTEIATVLFHDSGLPAEFHFEIFAAAAYLRNRVGFVHKTGKTPFELWFGRRPTFDHIRTFGCKVHYFYNPDNRPRTAVMAAREGVLLGYDTFDSHYWVLNTDNELIVTQDLRFTENERGPFAEIPIHDLFDIVRPARLAEYYETPEIVTSGDSELMSIGSARSYETYNTGRSGGSSSARESIKSSLQRLARSFTERSDGRSVRSGSTASRSSASGSKYTVRRDSDWSVSGNEYYSHPSRGSKANRRPSINSNFDDESPGQSMVRGVSAGRESRRSARSGSLRAPKA